MKDNTELSKRFGDNESFHWWLAGTVVVPAYA
jgi:hypothetical protein